MSDCSRNVSGTGGQKFSLGGAVVSVFGWMVDAELVTNGTEWNLAEYREITWNFRERREGDVRFIEPTEESGAFRKCRLGFECCKLRRLVFMCVIVI